MQIAVFGDVHANLHALQAVLADIDNQSADLVVCLGDLVGYGAFPNEVIETVRNRGIISIVGNYDEGVGFDKEECGCAYTDEESRRLGELSFAWTRQHVSKTNKAFLRTMLNEYRLEANGKRLLFVHGSPRKINEYLYEDRPDSSFERLAESTGSDVIVFGHTHLAYTKTVGEVVFVNPGSVGKPKDGDPRASYAILDVTEKEIRVRFVRVEYDVVSAVLAVRQSGLPAHFAEVLETGSA